MMGLPNNRTPFVAAVSRQRGSRVLMWRMSIVLVLLFCSDRGSCYDYAVQPEAVYFTEIPHSQTVIEGERVRLTCNFTIVKLGSNYPVPHSEWRRNGVTVGTPTQADKSDIERGSLYSEMVIDSASVEDAGWYECIAVDGKRKGEWVGEGNHIISSPRAHIQVVRSDDFQTNSAGSGSVLELYGMETITLKYGQPYIVPCSLGTVGISYHILWYQNGTIIDRAIKLVNGSLLIAAATADDAGIYHCSLQIGDGSVESQPIEILVTTEPYHGAPHIYIDVPHTLPLLPGGTLHIYCYILGATPPATPLATPLEVEVLKDGRWQLAGSPDVAESPFKQVYVIETGSYTCRLIDNGTILSADTVEVVPGYVQGAEDVTVFVGGNRETLTSSVPGGEPYQSVHWYRNGELLQPSGPSYVLEGGPTELGGSVYQSFVVTAEGVVYQNTWRVFDARYTNPPTDMHCTVHFQDFKAGLYHPRVLVTWAPPDFIALSEDIDLEYNVYQMNGLSDEEVKTTLKFGVEFELDGLDDLETSEGVYALFVNSSLWAYNSAPARCDFNTISRAINEPLPLSADCSSSSVVFTWTNQLARRRYDVGISIMDIHVVCLYGNHTPYHFELSYDKWCELDYYVDPDDCIDDDELHYELSLTVVSPSDALRVAGSDRVIPRGAVCRATGRYLFDHGSIDVNSTPVTMPPVSCVARPSQVTDLLPREEEEEEGEMKVYLELVCSEGCVNMTWFTSTALTPHTSHLTLHTVCLNSTDNKLHTVFSSDGVSLSGSGSVEGEGLLLCSFYGEFTDSDTGDTVHVSPVHCYRDQPLPSRRIDPQPVLPTATPTETVPSMTTLPSRTTLPSSTTSYTIILKVSIPGSVVILSAVILVSLLLIILKCRSSAKYNARRLQFTVEWEKLDKNFQPFNPDLVGRKATSVETIYEDCSRNGDSPPLCGQVFKLDTGTPSDSGTDPAMSDGVKDGGRTPLLSPVVLEVATATEDSGCGLQFDASSSDGTHGKEHLFNRFLMDHTQTNISKTGDFKLETRELGATTSRDGDTVHSVPHHEAASLSIAQMVADRLQTSSDTAVPSSGYGTIDCYKLSTTASDIGPEYLARKLRDVEESESDHDDLLNPDKAPPTKKPSKLNLALSGVVNGDEDSPNNNLPSLLLTPPQLVPHSSSGGTPLQLGLVSGLSSSASTGDLSSSYYQDNEGYLHVSSAANSGQTDSNRHNHHHSLDMLTKSL